MSLFIKHGWASSDAATHLMPALWRQRQADLCVWGQPGLQSEFQVSQRCTEKPCLETTKTTVDTSYKWSTTAPTIVWLAYFISYPVFIHVQYVSEITFYFKLDIPLYIFIFWDRLSLSIPDCPGTCYVYQADLKHRDLPVSVSQVLGLKVCTTIAWLEFSFLKWSREVIIFLWMMRNCYLETCIMVQGTR